MKEFRLLEAHEIKVREGQKNKDKTKKALLLYKDARADMARLDEEFPNNGWQRDHKDVHGVAYCGVGIWDEDKRCWVWRWDAGEKSQTSPEKGEASDSFKRACVNFGIGRELYTAPQMWVDVNVNCYELRVDYIEYDEQRRIRSIIIVNKYGEEVIRKGIRKAADAKKTDKAPQKIETPRSPELTEREQDELDAARAQCDFAESLDSLYDIYEMYEHAQFAKQLAAHCAAIRKQKGW